MSSISSSSVTGRGNVSKIIRNIIVVRFGECVKKIGIDGSSEAIQDAIKAVFRLRTKQLFWLEDENGVTQTLDRNMPLGNYTLRLDDGITMKICPHGYESHLECQGRDVIFYSQDDLSRYLINHHWTGLEGSKSCKSVDFIDDLIESELYRGHIIQKEY